MHCIYRKAIYFCASIVLLHGFIYPTSRACYHHNRTIPCAIGPVLRTGNFSQGQVEAAQRLFDRSMRQNDLTKAQEIIDYLRSTSEKSGNRSYAKQTANAMQGAVTRYQISFK